MKVNVHLMNLARRVEKVGRSDPVLDALIWLSRPEQAGVAGKNEAERLKQAEKLAGASYIPRFTASLDCARSLVVPGHAGGVEPVTGSKWRARMYSFHPTTVTPLATAKAAMPEAAFCAAALRDAATLPASKGGAA